MKLGFSTVGCPKWKWNEITTCAVDLGYNGIEVRGLGDDLFLPELKMFLPENLQKTSNDLKKNNLEICCLSSDVYLHDASIDAIEMLKSHIQLAHDLKVKYIRVLGDSWGNPGENVDADIVKQRLTVLAPIAQNADVCLLVETNGIWAETARLRKLITDINSSAVGVLWDINHPACYFNEPVETTFANIGEFVKHVHVKDSVGNPPQYKMIGYGQLPIKKAIDLLKSINYDGYLSLEWVKLWNDELEDAGIVFSHFVYQMKKIAPAAEEQR